MTRKELIKKYIEFFKSKGHAEIPSASLVPANDPTVLFTTAGMHPLVPFLLGQKHPLGKRLVNVQGCVRTVDIDSVGDSCHHTFFEMMGNWSLGDYFKKEAIEWSFEFAVNILKLNKKRLAVSVFAGNEYAEKDIESADIWKSLGIDEKRIAYLEDNWWQHPSNNTPCGPCTEMFYWKLNDVPAPENFDPANENWVEIWNDVLMGFTKISSVDYKVAKQKNIDNGRGLERVLAVVNKYEDNYLADIWQPLIKEIEKISKKKYSENKKEMRIIADHLKAAVFIVSDGVVPGNSERGYVLRRLIRRVVRYGRVFGLKEFTRKVALRVFDIYSDNFELQKQKQAILDEIEKEETRFNFTLEQGIKAFEKIVSEERLITGKDAFLLYQSYGFPIEITVELATEAGIVVNVADFDKELGKHQELSRTASAGTFKSGLADNSEQTTKLHTATHLLNEALREVVSKDIKQKGSNINPERLRFDFNSDRKLTPEEIKKIEDWVNDKIKQGLEVKREEMKLKDALSSGAQGEFGTKYPEVVSVYSIGEKNGKFTSKEICTGPHVKNTKEIGKFKILKEESSAAGVRRIKATVS
ncbi:alanine--tRNA ligase [Candidatus Pacearchaeota archaeon]|nr:alanine--tRNA ligase [Candidatus Pacearchaeota archaeon]